MFRISLLEHSVRSSALYGPAYRMRLGTETHMLLRYLLPYTYVLDWFLFMLLLQL